MSDSITAVAAPSTTTVAGKNLSRQDVGRLKNAAADFEALYLQQMLQAMRRTIPEGKPGEMFQPGPGERLFREMLDGEYAKVMSRRANGVGFKEMLLRHLTQEGAAAYRNQSAAKSATQAVEQLRTGGQVLQATEHQVVNTGNNGR
ncbi:MAG: rod-binding protein [Magnetococcales bacterium]|nr:rod-binding protein [Magnetococcales bacterium]